MCLDSTKKASELDPWGLADVLALVFDFVHCLLEMNIHVTRGVEILDSTDSR
jgi:hypothetical protein